MDGSIEDYAHDFKSFLDAKHGKTPVISFITQFLIDFRVITFTEEDNPEGVFLNIVDDAVLADVIAQKRIALEFL